MMIKLFPISWFVYYYYFVIGSLDGFIVIVKADDTNPIISAVGNTTTTNTKNSSSSSTTTEVVVVDDNSNPLIPDDDTSMTTNTAATTTTNNTIFPPIGSSNNITAPTPNISNSAVDENDLIYFNNNPLIADDVEYVICSVCNGFDISMNNNNDNTTNNDSGVLNNPDVIIQPGTMDSFRTTPTSCSSIDQMAKTSTFSIKECIAIRISLIPTLCGCSSSSSSSTTTTTTIMNATTTSGNNTLAPLDSTISEPPQPVDSTALPANDDDGLRISNIVLFIILAVMLFMSILLLVVLALESKYYNINLCERL